jgi:hypothetical protein
MLTDFEAAANVISNLDLAISIKRVTTLAEIHEELAEVPGLAAYIRQATPPRTT